MDASTTDIIGIVGFKYVKSVEVAENVSIPPNAPGCNCKGKCTNAEKCSCARLNGNDFPYVHDDGGRWGLHCWFEDVRVILLAIFILAYYFILV